MTRALSSDLRRRAIAAVSSGMTRRAAAERFGVSASSVIRWVAEWRASGREHALRQGGDRRSHRIEVWFDSQPDLDPDQLVFIDETAISTKMARLLFLAPYSPDFNPIENILAKMKAWIRRVAPRTLDALQDAVCSAIDDVCYSQAAARFAAAGYEPD